MCFIVKIYVTMLIFVNFLVKFMIYGVGVLGFISYHKETIIAITICGNCRLILLLASSSIYYLATCSYVLSFQSL